MGSKGESVTIKIYKYTMADLSDQKLFEIVQRSIEAVHLNCGGIEVSAYVEEIKKRFNRLKRIEKSCNKQGR
jgi:hypothetical protein